MGLTDAERVLLSFDTTSELLMRRLGHNAVMLGVVALLRDNLADSLGTLVLQEESDTEDEKWEQQQEQETGAMRCPPRE